MLQRIENRRALHKDVVEILSEGIIAGEIAPNSLLPPERELCVSMGVSRTVIREAIKLLESRGLVRIERGRGTVVQEANHAPVSASLKLLLRRRNHLIEDLTQVRQILEVGMAGLAARRRTEANLAAMEHWLEVMRQKPGEPEGYVDADLAFHAEIVRATQNEVLLMLLEPVSELLRESRLRSFSGRRTVKIRTAQHEEIFELIKQGDAEGARKAMSKHLEDTRKDLKQHQKARIS